MEPKTLQQHLESQVRNGISKAAIQEQLTAVGWSEDEVDKAYAEALIAIGVPVPTEGVRGKYAKRASTLDIVMNFFSFILLGIVATALGTLYHQIINNYFPDPLSSRDYYSGGMNTDAMYYAIAALIVAYPIYYLVVRVWFKRFREDEAKVESKLTKWITYLVLLVASVTIVGDLIAILFTFFQGEISTRFFLKALTILVIAGMVFGFYFLERKKVQYQKQVPRRTFQLFGYSLTVLILLGILLGFLAAGSPSKERMRSFDRQRADDLQQLSRCVDQYAQQFRRLPGVLAELEEATDLAYCAYERNDPATSVAYGYRVVTELEETTTGNLEGTFELCADFALQATPESADMRNSYYNPVTKWHEHPAGNDCDSEVVVVQKNMLKNMLLSEPVFVR